MKVLYDHPEFISELFGEYAAETGKLGNLLMDKGEMLFDDKKFVIFRGRFIDFGRMRHYDGDVCFSVENTKKLECAKISGVKIIYSALEEIEI